MEKFVFFAENNVYTNEKDFMDYIKEDQWTIAIVSKEYDILKDKKIETDVGIDLRCMEDTVIYRIPQLIPTGTKIAINGHGIFAMVAPRSSLPKYNLALSNSVGIIDPEYRGEIMLWLHSVDGYPVKVHKGDRFAQLCFLPYMNIGTNNIIELTIPISITYIVSEDIYNKWDEIFSSTRGKNGIGHTGLR